MNAREEFIMRISRGAVESWRKYKILPSVTMAQAILESGWGASGLTKAANNLFGIKANGWLGEVIEYPTKEYLNGKYVEIQDYFRKYKTLDDSISDHGKFLATVSRYSNIIGQTDYREACKLLQVDGYATAPNYAQSLIKIIEDNDLMLYDTGLFKFSAKVSGGDFDVLQDFCTQLKIETEWSAWK